MSAEMDHQNATALRQAAEAQAAEAPAATQREQDTLPRSPEEAARLLHELQVHQIELEMQNEELRRAQAELDAARARYFDLYDLAPVGYVTISEKGLILEANLTAATLLGVARGALIKRPFTGFLFREDQDLYYRHSKELFETGAPQACDLRMLHSTGPVFWARLEAVAAEAPATPSVGQESDAAPVCRVALSDITARKQTEFQREAALEALRESEERYRALFENVSVGVALISPNMEVLALNRRMREWFPDISPEQHPVCYRAFNSPPRDESCAYCPTRLTLADGQWHEAVMETPTPHGIRYYRIGSTAITDPAGKVMAAIEMVDDITERRQAEEKIRQQVHELERWYHVTLDRESRSLELKHEVNELLRRLNEPIRYPSAEK